MKTKEFTPISEIARPDKPMTLLERLHRFVFGEPLANSQIRRTLVSKLFAIPAFCSDAISSVAYGGQQILLVLCAAGLWAPQFKQQYTLYTMGISLAIVCLLAIVAASYRQTVRAYPRGGGSYIVARENLGVFPGLIAAAALLIDYVLTVAVSVSAGIQNLKDIPFLKGLAIGDHPVIYCIAAITALCLVNLRGLKESGRLFALPTYIFILMCYSMIGIGIFGSLFHWHLHMEYASQTIPGSQSTSIKALNAVGLFVILRAFANGCSAMTGVEAITNCVPSLKKPKSENAAFVLVAMAAILGTTFLGLSWLCSSLHILYWKSGSAAAPAVIDQISGTIFGKQGACSFLYLLTQFSTALVLVLAAQTSFAGFPRLVSILADDSFLPKQLRVLGDKLAFDNGIILLAVFSSVMIVIGQGSVDLLIPFFAIGVFTAFTLSQTGMVKHWFKNREPGWSRRAAINGLGALTSFVVVLDIAIEKFADGAWLVMAVTALLMFIFKRIHSHYTDLALSLDPTTFMPSANIRNTVLVLVNQFNAGTLSALAYAKSISSEFRAIHVEIDPEQSSLLEEMWQQYVSEDVKLVILKSPYRSLVSPLMCYLEQVLGQKPNRRITVLVGEYVPVSPWTRFLHGDTAALLHRHLLGRKDVVISNVRYWLEKETEDARAEGAREEGAREKDDDDDAELEVPKPAKTNKPDGASKQKNPVKPDLPGVPAKPDEPDKPHQPDEPDRPHKPDEPDKPHKPDKSNSPD